MKKLTVKAASVILGALLLFGCAVAPGSLPPVPTPPVSGGSGTAGSVNTPTVSADGSLELISTTGEDISYVLIYNPDIYDEFYPELTDELSTGSFGKQIDVDAFRAEELDSGDEFPFKSVTPAELGADVSIDGITFEENRADKFITPYSVGDVHSFYCYDESLSWRVLTAFECRYAGSFCNIWTCDSLLSDIAAERFGLEFDSKICPEETAAFGFPRFFDNGAKVNILFAPMEGGILGYVYNADIYSKEEADCISEYYGFDFTHEYGANTDHAIVNINSNIAAVPQYETVVFATMAHEYQHMINGSLFVDTVDGVSPRTWINEGMSGYIEENLYPGVKALEGHYYSFATSYAIRHGQSMYNFANDGDDIGVYGSVYLFSEYLASLGGDGVFSSFCDYWRNSYSPTLDEGEAIANAVGENVKNDIANSIAYPAELTFKDEDDEWLSKLTFSFYLSLLCYDESDPRAYANVKAQTLLYDEINPADIEAGGRVIAALSNGTYTVPSDADYGLIYVGLDKNFNVITNYIYH